MDVLSVCPLLVGSLSWQPQTGSHALTVVCKATFDLGPGKAQLASVQDFPWEEDNHWNDDESCSLYTSSDLAPFKAKADVTLVGDAYAPEGKPARSVLARLIVGRVDKMVEVFRDRHFTQQGQLLEGKRFAKMALRYERAAGGPHTNNPVGVDPEAEPDRYGRMVLPNLQPPGLNIAERGDVIEPIGFGPIAASWPSRQQLLGPYAGHWSDSDWHQHPLPTDFGGGFFNAAPTDQRLDDLRHHERIVLENLHPDHPRLVCHLPGLKPRAFVERSGAVRELPLRADTLWIDTTRRACTVTWRGRVDLERPDESGRVLVGMEAVGERITWGDVCDLVESGIHDEGTIDAAPMGSHIDDEFTAVGGFEIPQKQALPFTQSEAENAPHQVSMPSQKQSRMEGMTGVMEMIQIGDRSPAWMRGEGGPETGPPKGEAYAKPPPPPPASEGTGANRPSTPAPDDDVPLAGAGMTSPWATGKGPAVSKTEPQPPAQAERPPSSPGPQPAVPPGSPGPPPISPAAPSAGPPPISPTPGSLLGGSPSPGFRPPNPVEALRNLGQSDGPTGRVQPASATPGQKRAPAQPPAHEIVELVWYDDSHMRRIREQESWAELLSEIAAKRRKKEPIDFDEAPPPEEPDEVRDRRAVVAIMTRGHVTGGVSLHQTMLEAVDDSGSFEPPLVLMSGQLHFPFDQLETLRATVTAVTPLIAGNKDLQETVDAVNELLQTPWLESSGDVAENLTDKVRAAFKRGDRVLDPSYLDNHTDRILLERRCYQRRTLFGEEWIRALIAPAASRVQIPAYIPDKLAKDLPMFKRFHARVVAEAHVQQDEYESHENALKVVAFGRVISFTKGPQSF
jgi:hypothetical protein